MGTEICSMCEQTTIDNLRFVREVSRLSRLLKIALLLCLLLLDQSVRSMSVLLFMIEEEFEIIVDSLL